MVDVALLEDKSESSASINADIIVLSPSIVSTDVSELDHRAAAELVKTKPIANEIIENVTGTVQALIVFESRDEVIVAATLVDDNDHATTKKKT